MGITERRERERLERRRTILNSAKYLILSRGIENVSMEDIADNAEYSKATLYLYFTSKELLLHEICEESAQAFLEKFTPILETGIKGFAALKIFWRGYVELFGNFDEMMIVFQVRNFITPGIPVVSYEEQANPSFTNIIIETMKNMINQCKEEGVFDPDLNIDTAARLLLSTFSIIVENAARLPPEARKAPSVMEEMQTVFQIIIHGFAKEGVDRASLNIS